MVEFFKVSSRTYSQIADHFSAVDIGHAVCVGTDQLGYMEPVDKDEDRIWYDYFIREDYYNRYQLACA